jgi:uncharacterized repeat protein (TIGR04052 family)
MSMQTRLSSLMAASLLASGLGVAGAAVADPVTLRFDARIAGQPFACGQRYAGIGATRTTLVPTDLRFYVSDVQLLRADGGAVPVRLKADDLWQLADVALVDFEDATGACRNGTAGTRTIVEGEAPAGRYTGLRFTVGVPFALNHGDPTIAPAPLNLTAMFWTWQSGYKFMKFDAAVERPAMAQKVAMDDGHGAIPASGFAFHLGSTACAGESRTAAPSACRNPNRMTVQFDRFDAATQVVELDLGALLADARPDVNTPKTSPGCMSFPGDADCRDVIPFLGLAYDGVPAQPQRLFRVR